MANKKGGVLGAVGRAIGPKCSLCCAIFSLFGIIVLVVVGALINGGNAKVQGETVLYDSLESPVAHSAFKASIIYVVFFALCSVRYFFARRKGADEGDDEDDDN